jgi:hypothetical protein
VAAAVAMILFSASAAQACGSRYRSDYAVGAYQYAPTYAQPATYYYTPPYVQPPPYYYAPPFVQPAVYVASGATYYHPYRHRYFGRRFFPRFVR